MYADHFKMRRLPFDLSPDTTQFAAVGQYREALTSLKYGLAVGEGFLCVTGDNGLGKTMLCRMLMKHLANSHDTAYLPAPNMEPAELRRAIATDLGVDMQKPYDAGECLQALQTSLLDRGRQGRRAVVIIDEAQTMSNAALEDLRLLANLEAEQRKLIQVVLFCSTELRGLLRQPTLRALNQRLSQHIQLSRLDEHTTVQYIQLRLIAAGLQGPIPFSSDALMALSHAAQGIPRLTNILTHKSMISGFARRAPKVEARDVRAAMRESADQLAPTQALLSRIGLDASTAAAAAACTPIIAAGAVLASWFWMQMGAIS